MINIRFKIIDINLVSKLILRHHRRILLHRLCVLLPLSQIRGACFTNVTFTRSSWRRNQEEQQEKLIGFAQRRGTTARRNRRPSNKSTCLVLIRLRSRASVQNEISPGVRRTCGRAFIFRMRDPTTATRRYVSPFLPPYFRITTFAPHDKRRELLVCAPLTHRNSVSPFPVKGLCKSFFLPRKIGFSWITLLRLQLLASSSPAFRERHGAAPRV